MKDTNAIEKALLDKISKELDLVSNEMQSNNDLGTNLNQNQYPNMQQQQVNYNQNPNMQQGGNDPNMPQQDSYRISRDMTAGFERDNYMAALSRSKYAFIQQKVELLEVLTGCETKNRYSVILNFPNGTSAFLFKCKEDSSWCSRNCVS